MKNRMFYRKFLFIGLLISLMIAAADRATAQTANLPDNYGLAVDTTSPESIAKTTGEMIYFCEDPISASLLMAGGHSLINIQAFLNGAPLAPGAEAPTEEAKKNYPEILKRFHGVSIEEAAGLILNLFPNDKKIFDELASKMEKTKDEKELKELVAPFQKSVKEFVDEFNKEIWDEKTGDFKDADKGLFYTLDFIPDPSRPEGVAMLFLRSILREGSLKNALQYASKETAAQINTNLKEGTKLEGDPKVKIRVFALRTTAEMAAVYFMDNDLQTEIIPLYKEDNVWKAGFPMDPEEAENAAPKTPENAPQK
ncbi:MAG: hypothetical protein Q4G69_10255 [Planctomycetia bacterium]|nr:hypothetical protein [Planctomycetia bacterium]